MDTVILAAGANERLRGIVPPYHKPLLVVNGKPIIAALFDAATRQIESTTDRIIVVCSQENVRAINDILRHRGYGSQLRLVIQTDPIGPVEALNLGLELCISGRVMMLCGDNVIDDLTWKTISELTSGNTKALVVSVQSKTIGEVERFTVVKEPDETNHHIHFGEGFREIRQTECVSYVRVWIGPVIFANSSLHRGLVEMGSCRHPWIFANLFNEIARRDPDGVTLIESRALDIGVPEALS